MNIKEKAKRGERWSRAAVEFIVPLQLEQCLYHINHQPLGMPLRVTVESAEDGTMHLTALLRHNGVVTVCCEGELRRWEGTSTQVMGQAETQIAGLPDVSWACGVFLIFIMAWVVVTGLSILPPVRQIHSLPGVVMVIFSPIWLYLTVYVFVILLRRWLNRRELMVRLKRVLNGTEKY